MIPKDLRPKAFAALELFLDLTHVARSLVKMDLETTLIWFSITEATLRPLMLGRAVPVENKRARKAAPEDLGGTSRLMIAERTGLPRETVRRKIKALLDSGLVAEESHGSVRTVLDITAPLTVSSINESYRAVLRYQQRLRELGAS